MAQAVHPRFPIEGDEGQQTEEDDQRSLEAMRNEGEEFGQFGGNVMSTWALPLVTSWLVPSIRR